MNGWTRTYDLRELVGRKRRAYEFITTFATVELAKDYKLCMPIAQLHRGHPDECVLTDARNTRRM